MMVGMQRSERVRRMDPQGHAEQFADLSESIRVAPGGEASHVSVCKARSRPMTVSTLRSPAATEWELHLIRDDAEDRRNGEVWRGATKLAGIARIAMGEEPR